jgi:hypothetical protein
LAQTAAEGKCLDVALARSNLISSVNAAGVSFAEGAAMNFFKSWNFARVV